MWTKTSTGTWVVNLDGSDPAHWPAIPRFEVRELQDHSWLLVCVCTSSRTHAAAGNQRDLDGAMRKMAAECRACSGHECLAPAHREMVQRLAEGTGAQAAKPPPDGPAA